MSFTEEKTSDNYITTERTWDLIIPFIPKDKKIWEPFFCDGKSGNYLKEKGFDVYHKDKDFFEYEPKNYDIIVSNPPFSKKKEVFERLKELDKPFIMIAPSMMLGYKYFQNNFANRIQVIIPSKRISFVKLGEDKNYNPPFAAFIFCYKMDLNKDLIFLEN